MVSAKRSRQRKQTGREDVQSARNLVEFAVDRPGSHEPSCDLAIGRELRYRDLTGVTLAGLSSTLTRIENGDVAPLIQTRVRMAEALEVPTSMVFHRPNRRPSADVVPSGTGRMIDRSGTRHRA